MKDSDQISIMIDAECLGEKEESNEKYAACTLYTVSLAERSPDPQACPVRSQKGSVS